MYRCLVICLAALLAVPSAAMAAAPSWLDTLLGTPQRVVHRHVVHKPAEQKKPVTPARRPVPPSSTPAAEALVPPLPRPRPADVSSAPTAAAEPEAKAAPPAPASTPAQPSASGAPAPAASATTVPPKPPTPPRIYQTACPAVVAGEVAAKALPPIDDGQCKAQSPLSVTAIAVNGRMVPLTSPATVDCQMATDLPGWVAGVDTFAQSTMKAHIADLTVGGSYECRPRVTPDAADTALSEHGRADAVDVTGFTLSDGRKLAVASDYNSADAATRKLMHFAHDDACTRFTTVLGPDANSLHNNHFHLDLACHGKTCTYRLCE